jgi:hypothetical protein
MSDLPIHKPAVVARLQDRAAVEDSRPQLAPEEAARANLVAQLAVTSDPEEIKTIATALAALGKITPDAETKQAEDGIDLSGISDAALEELLHASELKALPAGPEREAFRKSLWARCMPTVDAPEQPPATMKPAPGSIEGYPTKHAGQGWRR